MFFISQYNYVFDFNWRIYHIIPKEMYSNFIPKKKKK